DFNKNGTMDVFENPQAETEARIEDLLRQMSADEKTAQMVTLYGSGRVLKDPLPTPAWKNEVWKDGVGNIDEEHNGISDKFKGEYLYPYSKHVQTIHAIQRWFVEETRLGIPVDFTNEGIRGLCHYKATLFPAQSGQGATWNKDLVARIARITAVEARALGYTNIYSPILDIAQDPRWGRVVECYGEDPYLVGQLGKQQVQGLQAHRVVSTPKHFAVYSIPVGGRDGDTRTDPHIAPRDMRTLYIEPFRVAFAEAHALGVMSSYNDYDGIPITGSRYFLTQILRNEWGFRGYVVSDSHAVEYLLDKHRVAGSAVDAAAMAVNAGLNVRTNFTMPDEFLAPLREALRLGKVSMATIDERVRDVLRVKFWLGLFDNPYSGNEQDADKLVACDEHKKVSLEAARQCIVLLKNGSTTGNASKLGATEVDVTTGQQKAASGLAEGESLNAAPLLPLSKTLKRVAVIGPNADESRTFVCRYGPASPTIVTVREGIQQLLPQAEVLYEKGCDIVDARFPESEIIPEPPTASEQAMIDKAVVAARGAELAVVVLGGSERTVRESYSRTSLDLPGHQLNLLQAVYRTGTPVALVLIDGRAVSINWANKHIPAIVQASFPGEFMGTAIAEVLFGDYNPGGKLAVTYPKSAGQIPFAFPFKPGADSKGVVRVSGALYPFGFGLSYTTFAYSDLQLSAEKIGRLNSIEASCKITNTGARDGDEVVQLYLCDEEASVVPYMQVLRGFERLHLAAGETKEVRFFLTPQDLGLWNAHNEFVVEPGFFELRVGASSQDIRLRKRFEVVE
ncbi:MAG: glycoside hydrolase family 3 C-terminal domain-containing protein, partial [Prevotellaceae bacterium]|nr:glycoside hydrolase family 3 C-terminal domain-containing protein [Prevotellaceae bacterium]